MGNLGSTVRDEEEPDLFWTNGQTGLEEVNGENGESSLQAPVSSVRISLNQLSEEKRLELNEFKFDMERKHEKRREILDAKKKQFDDLRETVKRLTEENERLKSHNSSQKSADEHTRLLMSTKNPGGVPVEELERVLSENCVMPDQAEDLDKTNVLLDKNRQLRISIAEMQAELQSLNSVVVDFDREREEYKAHVVALKDVINVSKKMLLIRESQLKELREKVESIEVSLSGKEMNILSQDLRMEYERQLQSIRNLRVLYEERQQTDQAEKRELKKTLDETKKELEAQQAQTKEAEERISELEDINSQKYDQIKALESNLGLTTAESRQYQAELTVINQLFSEILLGFNSSQEINLDILTKHLEDNHALLQNIVNNESSSALPKVLLDLVYQVHSEEEKNGAIRDEARLGTIIEEADSQAAPDQINSAAEIVELLPKVWRVLIELLSHHKVPPNIIDEESTDDSPCYKTVQTPKGPSLVLSVSQTFIRLKDLILEKKSLEKETGHLKQLNTHLESRLQDQEKRLQTVSTELNKTWHVVGKLQKEHQLLHTQEKILRYELAQKRKLLTSLREELQYSREKWQEAREKNSKTEKQWKQLRVEFATRRNTIVNDEFNNSQESGYSDERCSSDDEPGYETDVSECAPKPTEPEAIEEVHCCEAEESRSEALESKIHLTQRRIEQGSRAIESSAENAQSDAQSQGKEESCTEAPILDATGSSSEDPQVPSSSTSAERPKTLEEMLAAKEERLKRLEGQCGQLMQQVNGTTQKSLMISNKLDDLHEVYGERSAAQPTEDTENNCDAPASSEDSVP
ncbi:putative WEB family protein At1g65010, chloroplastic [Dendroctonus ponderosae]|uniref:Uncharacterized protein n=1 Tax=Dendroctonus ponderosae TaxID=77166 RepID=U4UJN1_DENPD|nr:putative WEB family protein At1g65010, chloroplastic [Dendroctonus ponderosae]ERL93317.1 hypothetical protein D910_10611 [Dendroctonus ponderosae]KAH1010821.1 hypothetical protein HUJ05_005064 [Dendroctonus ponderosae]